MVDAVRSDNRLLYRMIGVFLAGVSLLVCAYAAYLYWMKIPRLNEIYTDFDLALPGLTNMFVDCPWLVLPFPAIAYLLGIMTAVTAKRIFLILSGLALLGSIGGILLASVAMESPMLSLMQSVSG